MRGNSIIGGGEDIREPRREERGDDRDDEGSIRESRLERSSTKYTAYVVVL